MSFIFWTADIGKSRSGNCRQRFTKSIRIASWAEGETGRLGTTAYDTMNNLHDLTWILRIAMHNTSAQREAESPAERDWKLAKDAKQQKEVTKPPPKVSVRARESCRNRIELSRVAALSDQPQQAGLHILADGFSKGLNNGDLPCLSGWLTGQGEKRQMSLGIKGSFAHKMLQRARRMKAEIARLSQDYKMFN